MKSYNIQIDTSNILPKSEKSPYILDKNLGKAIEVAISLGMPLLITGEPGTGKTKLADKVAQDLSTIDPTFLPQPLKFFTKTTSTARDLFYSYDALGHFHDANISKASNIDNSKFSVQTYIQLQALGKAIALTQEKEIDGQFIKESFRSTKSSVVLIDEIDKAPRDFPNDILNEIENFSFSIKEANGYSIRKNPNRQIIVILTSNSEKNLPEAFLRRTIFYHIPFPKVDQLTEIVIHHLGLQNLSSSTEVEQKKNQIQNWVDFFESIRAIVRNKKPSTAELIAWIKMLDLNGLLKQEINIQDIEVGSSEWLILQHSFSILAKTNEDMEILRSLALRQP